MRRVQRSLFTALVILVLAAPAAAQRAEEIVRWRAVGPAAAVRPGATFEIELSAEVEPGWHVYAMSQQQGGPRPLLIEIPRGHPFAVRVKDIVAPLPSMAEDPNFNLVTQFYADSLTLTVPATVARTARGKLALPLDVTFQACSARVCLRPFTTTLTVPVTVAAEPRGRRRGRAR